MKTVYTSLLCLIFLFSISARASDFYDNFSVTHDYKTNGVSGTGWDGMVGTGTGETCDALNSNSSRSGQLFLQSTSAVWADPWNPLGPFLYKMASGNFTATIKVTEYQNVLHNNGGVMARARKSPDEAGTGEDWVSLDYFPIWNCGNFVRSANDNGRTEHCHNGLQFNLHPYMRITREDNTFHFETSPDNLQWTEMSCSPLTRTDFAGLSLQVGIFQATYSTNQGYIAFDDFSLVFPKVTKATNPSPTDGAWSVDNKADLSWTAGELAVSHNVYFGTNYDAVDNATTSSPEYKGNQAGTTYDPGALSYEKAYYWRIDEVNTSEPESPWKGNVWRFKTGGTLEITPTVTVDPGTRLSSTVVLGEWNTAGNFEGWTGTDVSGFSVTGGYITGTGTSSTPSIQKSGLASPDLDFGYYDYLQIRIRVPSSFNDDIIFSFGTSVNSGFDVTRVFRIPSASIVKDGNWHIYRLDLGLVVLWRDTLADIQIKPLGNSGNGQTFYIDYVEVGDLPGDTLSVNTDLNFYTGENLGSCSRIESKHACFWYSPQSYVEYPDLNPSVMGRRALRMLEESWQVYRKKLGYNEPFTDTDGSTPGRFKVNHTTWWGGFWMGGKNGFGYFNVPGYGLGDEGWGNPVPHEFGHVNDMHQPGFLTGGHWESHANYYQDNHNTHYAAIMSDHPSNINNAPAELSGFRQDHGHLIYQDYRIHRALQDYADDLGQSWDLAAKLWYSGSNEQTVYNKLATLLTGGVTVADMVGSSIRHYPFLDFVDGDQLKKVLWGSADDEAWWWYISGGLLIPSQDRAGWYRVGFERAPEKFAYMYHELVPSSSSITVEVQGLDLVGATEGWRWSLVAMDDYGNIRFSNLFSPGTQTFALNTGENKVYLIVVATPSDNSLNLEYTDNRHAVDKHSDRLHYAYEVRLVNCTPAAAGRQLNKTEAGGHSHSNGGGYVGPSATVDSTAYVGPNARVLGTSKVYNYARIEDYAVVMGNATVRDNAIVSGYAVVRDSAIVRNYAKVRDRAVVGGAAIVENNGLVEDYAHLYDSTNVKDSAIMRGVCSGYGSTVMSGTSIADYDASTGYTVSTGTHFSHVPWGDWYYAYYVATKKKPNGLVASYRTEETEGNVWWDEFGAQHAILRGSPTRVDDTTMNSKVLRLDGTDDYAVVDRSVCDSLAGTFGLWIKPTDNTDRPVLFLGSSATKYLKIALDSSGKAVFTITDGSTTKTVTSTSTIPAGSWSYVAATLSGSQAAIYVNSGTAQATTSTTLVPDDVLGNNAYTSAEGLYVGRDWAGNLFAGDVEDVRFYNVALSTAEIDNEIRRAGNVIGCFYYNSQVEFNGSSTTDESGVHNGVERVLKASIYPHTSDNVTYYEGILDCSDERDGAFEGSGFGLDNGQIVVRLDNVGFWITGVSVTLNTWQTVTLTFTGSSAQLYVNDIPRASKSYSATASDIAGKNYRIGYAMNTSGTKFYYDGLIKDIFISDKLPGADTTPPTPNPATWATVPYAVSSTEISMTATTGSDPSGPVEYYFDETTGNPGGTDSGWITSPTYNDTGLSPNTQYTYRVQMRDAVPNTGDWSTSQSATTPAAVPTFVAAGTVTSGTGSITPALPSGIATGDILLLFLETANQAISISSQNGGTWTEVTGSPQGTGTAGGTSATRLTVFWSRYNGTQTAPRTSDSGNHQIGRIIAIRNAASSGNPWDVTAGGVEATSDTSGSIPGATTTVNNTLVVAAIATSLPDASGTANFSSWANANLTSVTERTDNTSSSGNGGGLGIATGLKETAGAYGNTTVTCAASAVKGMISIAIKP